MFNSINENFYKIETEINDIKSTQNNKKIEELIENYEHKTEEEQRKI
jgi:hypothetical protein